MAAGALDVSKLTQDEIDVADAATATHHGVEAVRRCYACGRTGHIQSNCPYGCRHCKQKPHKGTGVIRHEDTCPDRRQGSGVARARAGIARGQPPAGLGNRPRPTTPNRMNPRFPSPGRPQRPSFMPTQRSQSGRPSNDRSRQSNDRTRQSNTRPASGRQPSTKGVNWRDRPKTSGSAKEAAEEEAEDNEMADADTDAETEEAANEAAEHQDDAESRNQELMSYCMALEEAQRHMLENQRQLPGLFDSVLDYEEADVGNLCIDSEELDRQFAEVAMDDDDESPLVGINYDELYSYRTRQAARKTTDRPAKRRKVSSTRQHLGASQGAYDASEEVIRHVATRRRANKERQMREAQRQEGHGSTSSASTQSRPPHLSSKPKNQQTCTPRSAYVLTVNALDRSAMDAKSVQIAMADLVEIQKALLDGMKLGPILNSTLVADIKHTSAVLEMAGRVVASTTESIQRRCKEMSQAAKQVIRACDLHSERPQISCPLCTSRSRWTRGTRCRACTGHT